MKGKFYGIGVGPGDPELLTLKAVRLLKECGCIVYPISGQEKQSAAFSIVEGYLQEGCQKLEVRFSMVREEKVRRNSRIEAAKKIKAVLDQGICVACLTLGDPTIYSTCMYLYHLLEKEYDCEIVPGIPSFCAAAARIGNSLAEEDETLAIVPVSKDATDMQRVLKEFDNIVFMKTSKHMEQIKQILSKEQNIASVKAVSRCTMQGEKVYYSLEELEESDYSYFTTMLVKKKRED